MAMTFRCEECNTVFSVSTPTEAECPTDPNHDGFVFLGDGPAVLTKLEKAYFDDIRNANNKVSLRRMSLDGTDVAVLTQTVSGTGVPEGTYMPLAIIADAEIVQRLRSYDGSTSKGFNPEDVIAETKESSNEVPDDLENL